MNRFLQAAVEQYPAELNNRLIHPIHQVDAKIITEILTIIEKAKIEEIKALLDRWKYLKDDEILQSLIKWNEEHSSFEDSKKQQTVEETKSVREGNLSFARNWICFRDFRIDLYYVRSYEKQDEYDFVNGRMEYRIVINALPSDATVTSTTTNKILIYSNMDARDRDFALLDTYFSEFPGIHFINNPESD